MAIAFAIVATIPDLLCAFAVFRSQPVAFAVLLLMSPILAIIFLTGAYYLRIDSRELTAWSTPSTLFSKRTIPVESIASIGVRQIRAKGLRYAVSVTTREGRQLKILDGLSTSAQAGAEAKTVMDWLGRYRGVVPQFYGL